MKNDQNNANKYIFQNTDSDYGTNNLNQSGSEHDRQHNYSETRNNTHNRSKRVIISRKSSKKNLVEIKDENISNDEILKTEFPNQRIIYPTKRTENLNESKNISFSNKNKEENKVNESAKDSFCYNNKIIIGKTILDSHRSNLIDIINKNNNLSNNVNQSFQSNIKENNTGRGLLKMINDNINTNNSVENLIIPNQNYKYLLKRNKAKESKNSPCRISQNKIAKANNIHENYDDNIYDSSAMDYLNNNSISNNIESKRENSINNNLNSQRSENFHKKSYDDYSKKSEYFPNYTTISKSILLLFNPFIISFILLLKLILYY